MFKVMNDRKSIIIGVFGILALAGVFLALPFTTIQTPTEETNNDGLHIKGHIHAVVTDKYGNVKQIVDKDNLVVSVGFAGIAKLGWNANSGTSPSATYRYIALGTSSTSASSSDTALGTEVSAGGYSRQLTTAPTYSAGVITLSGTFTGFACACVEVGAFDASTTGNMLSRTTYSAINIGSSDSLTMTYTFTLT